MEERIYTRAQKEASWKQKGLLVMPKSHRQGMLALAAKEFIEGLKCYWEVRRMLAAGKRPRDVAILIQQHNELPSLTFNTLKKYCQVYRSFFIPPLETLRLQTQEPSAGDPAIIRSRLEGIPAKVREISDLEQVMNLQWERIRAQCQKEKELGLPLPRIRLEMETLAKLVQILIDKKIELGIYTRALQRVDPQGNDGFTGIDQLSPEDRQKLKEFGATILQMIDHSGDCGSALLALA